MYTVFIVDDEPLIREGLRRLIDWEALEFSVIGDAASAEEAAEPILALQPDLLITDVRLPGTSGISMIQLLRQHGFQGEVFVISGYADFSYAKGAIRHGVKSYLIKPIDERELIGELFALKKTLAQKQSSCAGPSAGLSVSHQWFAFLHGQAGFPSGLRAEIAPKLTADTRLRIVVITSVGGHQSPLPENQVAEAVNAQNHSGLLLLYCPVTQAILLSSLPDHRLEKALRALLSSLNRGGGFEYGCVVGAPVDSLNDLPQSFSSAGSLWSRRFLYASGDLLWYRDMALEADDFNEETPQLAEQIQEALLYNRKETISDLLHRWRDHFIHLQSDELVVKIAFSNFMQQMLSSLAAKYPEITGELTDSQSLLKHIYLARSIQELTACLENRLHAIADHLSMVLPEAQMLRAVDFIERNYMNRLTVESIAQTLHYNSAYFGRKFKSYVGESFQAYLEKVRLEKAKRLILEGYKIYQVSTLVGFSSVDYFAEKFRQYTSLTPSQYRQQHSSGAL